MARKEVVCLVLNTLLTTCIWTRKIERNDVNINNMFGNAYSDGQTTFQNRASTSAFENSGSQNAATRDTFPQLPGSSRGNGASSGALAGSPFSSAAGSDNKGPFASVAGSSGHGHMAGPFSSAMGNKGGSNGGGPFTTNMGSGMDNGPDLSSMMSSGPGGLIGGNFLSGTNASLLMGTDFSRQMMSQGNIDNNVGVKDQGTDGQRFDTSAYESMIKDMFNVAQVDKELTDLGNPFDGNHYELPNENHNENRYDTSKEASVGSYASTDMSSYASSSGSGHSGSSSDNGKSSTSSSYGGNNSPFNVNNYDFNRPHSSSGYNNDIKSPFDTSNFDNIKSNQFGSRFGNNDGGNSPFTINNVGTNSMFGDNKGGSASGPFDTSKFSSLGSSKGQSPFSINRMSTENQSPFNAGTNMQNQSPFDTGTNTQNQNSGNFMQYTQTKGLDSYGNIDFGSLSQMSGSLSSGATNGQSYSQDMYSGNSHSYTGGNFNSNSYSPDSFASGQYSNNRESTNYRTSEDLSGSPYDTSQSMYSGSGYTGVSESQYKTPFESDNYNDLLDNPFKSESYFDSTSQNFDLPYEKTDTALQAGNGPAQQEYHGTGPAGDPFRQGGNNNRMQRR